MDGFPNWPPNPAVLLYLPALLVGFTVHELAHAVVAYLLGDTSQVERKRLSFNPLRHVSWVGLIVFLIFGFGWAKPVWVDARRLHLKNPYAGMFLVSIAGASANFLVALLALGGVLVTAVVVSVLSGSGIWDVVLFLAEEQPALDLQGLAVALSSYMMFVNLVLALFNLIPIPPLDGFQAVMSLIGAIRRGLRRSPDGGPRARPAPAATPGPAPGSAPGSARGSAPVSARGAAEAPPSPAQIHFDIGLDYHRQGEYDEAIARYRQAIVHDDAFALAYYNQGLAFWGKGQRSPAASSFRAAMQTSDDVGLRVQADVRLRELAQAERDLLPGTELPPPPPPLAPGSPPPAPAAGAAPDLDPALARRVWLRLALGGAGMGILAVTIWLFVTGVALSAMM